MLKRVVHPGEILKDELAEAVMGRCFTGGVVVYDGEMCTRFGERLYAVPIRLLWDTPMEKL